MDLTVKGGNKCNNWPDYPIRISGATGGLIGDTVIICGGFDENVYLLVDKCYSFTSKKATLVTHMSVGRMYAASIIINDHTLWVTGGYTESEDSTASTEFVTVTGTMLGPDLPIALQKHAMVAINSTFSMVIGGESGYLFVNYASTFFYDRNEGEWINGPSLMQARYDHAAGIVTDEVTEQDFVAVTGGIGGGYYLGSTEILQDGEWVQGKIIDATCYLLENSLVRKYNFQLDYRDQHSFLVTAIIFSIFKKENVMLHRPKLSHHHSAASSSKTAHRISNFSIAMGAKPLFKPKPPRFLFVLTLCMR